MQSFGKIIAESFRGLAQEAKEAILGKNPQPFNQPVSFDEAEFRSPKTGLTLDDRVELAKFIGEIRAIDGNEIDYSRFHPRVAAAMKESYDATREKMKELTPVRDFEHHETLWLPHEVAPAVEEALTARMLARTTPDEWRNVAQFWADASIETGHWVKADFFQNPTLAAVYQELKEQHERATAQK